LLEGWPAGSSAVVFRLDAGTVEHVAQDGDLEAPRQWASVSKMAVSLAFGVEVDWGLHEFDEVLGPRGATLAHLLSHSSGLGLERADPVVDLGIKRVYSNFAVDHAVQAIVGENSPANWLDMRIFRPFGMNDTRLEGRASSGVVGSTQDLVRLGVAWLRLDGLSRETRDRLITPFLAGLEGIVPGFGRFTPCPWGLGPEVRGAKRHWMGDWSEASFGHFGQSGAMLLLDADDQIGVVATSTEPFGPWAQELWPRWTSAARQLALVRG
jgi:CubicO group peptidase (beta-lactamase class C family)